MGGPLKPFDTSKTAALYNDRYNEFGNDVRTVGWGSQQDQILRFEVLFRGFDPRGKTILDIGCGLGDLVSWLDQRTNGDFRYIGVDIAEKLIRDARTKHNPAKTNFILGDALSPRLPEVDISVLSGALSYKVDGLENYARSTLQNMYELSKEAVSVNFLTAYVDYEVDKNQHYQPEVVFAWAKQLSMRVNLIHDYPLYEFTIQIIR